MSRHVDSREQYAPLADGETVLAPGQTETIAELVRANRKVAVLLEPSLLPVGSAWIGRAR
jgi:hypothetical protein